MLVLMQEANGRWYVEFDARLWWAGDSSMGDSEKRQLTAAHADRVREANPGKAVRVV
jgi:hypothetical protein